MLEDKILFNRVGSRVKFLLDWQEHAFLKNEEERGEKDDIVIVEKGSQIPENENYLKVIHSHKS